jgi:DNA-binding response OmpR family regulator
MIIDSRPSAFLVSYGRGADALALGLERAAFQVTTYDSFRAASSEAASAPPDLILFTDTADASHVPFLSELRNQSYRGLILYLSDSTDPQRVSRVLEAGAHDVVGPPHSVGAILLRRLVHSRSRAVAPRSAARSQLTLGDVTVDPTTHEVIGGPDGSFTLSGRELEVLVRLMEAQGDVVPRGDLLADIWGNDHRSEAVLDTTVHRLRKKLEEEISRPDLVATVRGVGYRLRTG